MNWGFHAGIPWISQFHAYVMISFCSSFCHHVSCWVIILSLHELYSVLQEPQRLYLHRLYLYCAHGLSPASSETAQHPWESGLNTAICQIHFCGNHYTKKLFQAYIWPYLSAVLSKPLSASVWRKLVAICHQQLTSMTLGPEMGWVRLSGGNSTSLSPFSHHFPWLRCHGVVAYATQNNNVILGKLCNELLSLVHQAPYMLFAGMLTNWILQVCHWWKTQKFTFYQTTWYTSMAWVKGIVMHDHY